MKKILVVRNDKIGDFMLAWPSFAMLKQSMPDCHITALVPSYTIDLAKLCPWIDDVIEDVGLQANKTEKKSLVSIVAAENFDVSINFFSNKYNAFLVWKAGIPYRLAPATKLIQFLYTHRLKQKRSQSLKPEYQYNLDLIRYFLSNHNIQIIEPITPYLSFDSDVLLEQRHKLNRLLNISLDKKWLYVHAGTGGSASNLSLEQYANLIVGIKADFELVLTAGPGEKAKANQLLTLILQKGCNGVVYDNNDGLQDFTRSIACADAFIAGSTGPLHIAATLDVPTIGFFPSKRSSTPLRWKPLNSQGKHLAFSPIKNQQREIGDNMESINIKTILPKINSWVSQYLS